MSDDKTYNGWKNYETWNVALWLGNEQGSDEYWREQSREAWDAAEAPSANFRMTGREPFTREERAAFKLADQLKEHFEEASADMLESAGQSASVWADLLSAALSEVDWREIAEHYIEDVDKTEDEPAEVE